MQTAGSAVATRPGRAPSINEATEEPPQTPGALARSPGCGRSGLEACPVAAWTRVLTGLLADLLLGLHVAFILFAIFGALFWLRFRWAPGIHLPALAWGVFIEWSGGLCPLTPLENALRRAAGEAGYSGSFVEHYLLPVVYPPGLDSDTQLVLGAGLLLSNAILYAGVWCWRQRRDGRRRDD